MFQCVDTCLRFSLVSLVALVGCGGSQLQQTTTVQVVFVQATESNTPVERVPTQASTNPTVASGDSVLNGPQYRWNFDEPSNHRVFDVVQQHPAVFSTRGQIAQSSCSGGNLVLSSTQGSEVAIQGKPGQFGTSDFSVSVWMKTTSTRHNAEIVSNRGDGSHGNFFNLRYAYSTTYGAGSVVFEIDQDQSGRGYSALVSKPGLNDGRWHHIVARRAGTHLSLFVDGQIHVDQTGRTIANVNNHLPLYVGASTVAGEYDIYFDGQVDELQLYDRALSDAEVVQVPTAFPGSNPLCTP